MQTRGEELRILQTEHELSAATASAPNQSWIDPSNPASPTLASPDSPCQCSSCLPQHWLGNGAHLWLLPTSSALVTHRAPWTLALLSLTSAPAPIWIQVTQDGAHHFPPGSLQGSHTLTLGFSLWATWLQDTGYPHNQQRLLLTEPSRSKELCYNMVHTILLLETKHNTINMHVRVYL